MKNLVLTLIFGGMLAFSMSALATNVYVKPEKVLVTSHPKEHRLSTEHGKKVEEVKGHVKKHVEEHVKKGGNVDKEKVKEHVKKHVEK